MGAIDMPIPRFRTVYPGDSLDAADLNRQREELTRLGNCTGSGWVEVAEGGFGLALRVDLPLSIFAKLTGEATGAYSFTQQRAIADGALEDNGDGFSGTTTSTPAYELNGLQGIPAGTYVRAWPAHPHGDVDYWLFSHPGGMSVSEVDGTPAYTGITTWQFDQTDGFVLTQPGAGVVRVDMRAASETQNGITTTAAQSYAGLKTFTNAAVFYTGTVEGAVTGAMMTRTATNDYRLIFAAPQDAGYVEVWRFRDSSSGATEVQCVAARSEGLGAGQSARIEWYAAGAPFGSGSQRADLHLIAAHSSGDDTTVLDLISTGSSGAEYRVNGVAIGTDESAQDAVGDILTSTSTIDLTYDDATPAISAEIVSLGVGTGHIANQAVTLDKQQGPTLLTAFRRFR